MNFELDLQRFLYGAGYQKVWEGQDENTLWVGRRSEGLSALGLIFEQLPGQRKVSLSEQLALLEEKKKGLMIQFNQVIEMLVLVVLRNNPSAEEVRESQTGTNVWFLDREDGRLLVYENQPSDFDHLREGLETFLEKSAAARREESSRDLKRTMTPVNTLLVAANILVFVILTLMGNTESGTFMEKYGAMTWDGIMERGEYYRLFCSMFLHFGAEHLVQNMIILMVCGSRLERVIGSVRYLILYLGAGLSSAVASLYFTLRMSPASVAAGASGAIFGVLGGLAFLILLDFAGGQRKRVHQIGPVGIIFMIGSALYYGFTGSGVDNAAHIGGLIGGFLLAAILHLLTERDRQQNM